MVKALFVAPVSANEQPNQQQTTQTYQNFPQPRPELLINQETQQTEHLEDKLFTLVANPQAIVHAEAFIDDQLKNKQFIKAGAFLIGLLEKLQTIPSEFVAEEATERAARIEHIEQNLLDMQQYFDKSGEFDRVTFNKYISENIGEEQITEYPVIQLIRGAIKQIRRTTREDTLSEVELITAQRLALFGIVKQMSVQ